LIFFKTFFKFDIRLSRFLFVFLRQRVQTRYKCILFQVRATDQAETQPRRSTTAIVKVRVRDGNNNYPTFPQSSYWIALPEDTATGTTVLTVKATDFDSGPNADITYESSASDVFPIHNKDGTVILRQRATPNKKYTFTITASDKGSPIKSSVAKVLVSVHSVSDTPPSFRKKKYFKEIPENFKVDAEVKYHCNFNRILAYFTFMGFEKIYLYIYISRLFQVVLDV